MKRNSFNKAEKRLVVISIGAIALLIGVTWWRGIINAEPRIIIEPQAKAPIPNGFDVYLQAAKLIVPANPAVDPINDVNPPTDEKIAAQKYSLARKEAWLKRNAAGFALFQKALALSCLHPPVQDDGGLFPHYSKFRELARFKRIEANTRLLRRDWNGAMRSRIDIAQMGNDMARGGVLISALVGVAIQAIACKDVEAEIERLDAVQARKAAKRLEEIYARRISSAEIMRGEKAYGQRSLLKQMRDSQWRDLNAGNEEWSYEKPTLRDRLRMATISKQAVVDNYSQIMDAVIANMQLPYAAPQKPLPASDNPLTRDNLGTMSRIRWNFARNDASNAMWLVALALHAYRLENKTYPATLQALVPRYLKQIPADPFGGEPLRFQRVGNSYVLWSVGPDTIDNGGKAIPHDKNAAASQRNKLPPILPDSKGDYVWSKNR